MENKNNIFLGVALVAIVLATIALVSSLRLANSVERLANSLGSRDISAYGRTAPTSGGLWTAIDNIVTGDFWATSSSTFEGIVNLGNAASDAITVSGTVGRGGTGNVALYARDTFTSGTTTLCSIENTDATARWILSADSDLTAASTTNMTALGVATSSTAARSIADTSQREYGYRVWPATSASSSFVSISAATSSSVAQTNGEYWRNIWPSGSFLNFYSSSSVDFGGSGNCGVLYR